jgi:hypothetical protein
VVWGHYVDAKNLYFQFMPVAKFIENIPWTAEGFQEATVKPDHPRIRALGLRGKSMSMLWVQNVDQTWWNVVHRKPVPVIDAARLTLSGFPQGRYRVEFWDTWTGVITR